MGGGVGKTGFAEAVLCAFTLTVGGLGEAEEKSGDQFNSSRVNCVKIERKQSFSEMERLNFTSSTGMEPVRNMQAHFFFLSPL